MTETLYSPKIKPEHLARKAIVYLRQSSEKQVRQNKESQRLQYDVAERMRALGWKQVEIVDGDLGCSAAMASARREGFERVLSSVALGEVGIVGSLEVSRLSRTDKDWCRLLEVCQIFGTLIADEQQVYDLNYLDDQLVLGIKGTLSVVELKVLRQRLQAGQESKARQGATRGAEDCRVFIPDHHVGYIDWATYEDNQKMIRRNSVNWQGDESMAAIRAGQGLLVGLLRCGHCGRKLHVRYWGGTGTNARYLCKGDYDDGGQYCLGFGGASVDRRLGQELLQVISPLGVEASLKALEELSAGDAAQRAALSSKLEQLEYEAKKAFEQYDAVDARNRLVAGELERRWNEKMEEVETTKQRLSSLNGKRWSLSSEEEERIRLMGGELCGKLAQRWLSSDTKENDLSYAHGGDCRTRRCG